MFSENRRIGFVFLFVTIASISILLLAIVGLRNLPLYFVCSGVVFLVLAATNPTNMPKYVHNRLKKLMVLVGAGIASIIVWETLERITSLI